MSKQLRALALLSITPGETYASKEGRFITSDLMLVASALALPWALIVNHTDGTVAADVAVCSGGSPGTWPVQLSATPGTVTRGTKLMLTSNGTVKAHDGSTSARIVAEACESGTANELIECVLVTPYFSGPQVIVDVDGATLTAAQSGAVISNLGASGAAAFVLPAAVPGLQFVFLVEVAQALQIDPDGTETIALPSTGVQGAAGKYLVADAIGEKVHLVCVSAGTWDVIHYSGTWTAEA
jgi:hypothetical protein